MSPYARLRPTATSTPQFVMKEVFMIDCDYPDALHGAKRAALYQNGQVKISVQLKPRCTAEKFKDAIEGEFSAILDMSMECPR